MPIVYRCIFCGIVFPTMETVEEHESLHWTELREEIFEKGRRNLSQLGVRLPLPVAGPSNVQEAGRGSGHAVSSFSSNLQPPLRQNIRFPPRYPHGSTTERRDEGLHASKRILNESGVRSPLPMAGPSNVREAGRGSGYAISSYNSSLQPPLLQNIPFPPQNPVGNTTARRDVGHQEVKRILNQLRVRSPFPMSRPINVGEADRGSGFAVSSFNSILQTPLRQSIPLTQYPHGNTTGFSTIKMTTSPHPAQPRRFDWTRALPLDPQTSGNLTLDLPYTTSTGCFLPIEGPRNGSRAGSGSGYAVSSFNSNLQPPSGQNIIFPSQRRHENTTWILTPSTGLPQPVPLPGEPGYCAVTFSQPVPLAAPDQPRDLNMAIPCDTETTDILISALPYRQHDMGTQIFSEMPQGQPVFSITDPQPQVFHAQIFYQDGFRVESPDFPKQPDFTTRLSPTQFQNDALDAWGDDPPQFFHQPQLSSPSSDSLVNSRFSDLEGDWDLPSETKRGRRK